MIKQMTFLAALTFALSGCATIQPEPSQKLVIPATVITTSPVNHISVGLFAPRQKGVDVIVKTQTKPAFTISIVQPAANPNVFKAGEQVKIICRINRDSMLVIQ